VSAGVVAPVLRDQPRPADPARVGRLVAASGFFSADEVEVAVSLVDEALAKGCAESGYHFVFADDAAGGLAGYACFGPIAGTLESGDLYWIAVDPSLRGQRLGTLLLAESERRLAKLGVRRVYVETSSRPLYEPTRAFYLARGYRLEATLERFYGPADGKLIFVRVLDAAPG